MTKFFPSLSNFLCGLCGLKRSQVELRFPKWAKWLSLNVNNQRQLTAARHVNLYWILTMLFMGNCLYFNFLLPLLIKRKVCRFQKVCQSQIKIAKGNSWLTFKVKRYDVNPIWQSASSVYATWQAEYQSHSVQHNVYESREHNLLNFAGTYTNR